jgi:hypothetical protein
MPHDFCFWVVFKVKACKELSYHGQTATCMLETKAFDRDSKELFILLGINGFWDRYKERS